jgi:excisionase family DNA binding protein
MRTAQTEPVAATIPEACRISGLGRSTVYNLIATGRLKSTKIGKRRLVILASLKAVLNAGAPTAADA